MNDRPKPLALVQGVPFLSHLIRYWQKQGIQKFILSVGYRYEEFLRTYGSSYEGSQIFYAIEERQLGTGGGLLLCCKQYCLEEPFVLLNGDTYFEVKLPELVSVYEKTGADWVFSAFPTRDFDRYTGLSIGPSDEVIFDQIVTNKQRKDCRWANGGVYLVNPSAFKFFKKASGFISLERDLWLTGAEYRQRFICVKSDSEFIDIGTPEDYERAQRIEFKK